MKRIQRQRTKGWRMPDGAVYVGRPSRWGNPFIVEPFMGGWAVDGPDGHLDVYETEDAARQRAVDEFRLFPPAELSGLRDATALACWCPLNQPCHADVLIELLAPQTTADAVGVLDEAVKSTLAY